jgi:hypothetical protein
MAVSACCPSHSSTTQEASRAAAVWGRRVRVLGEQPLGERLHGVPARIASASPNTVHAVGRCLRVVSRSMTSSCNSVKLWINSTAAAACTAAAC